MQNFLEFSTNQDERLLYFNTSRPGHPGAIIAIPRHLNGDRFLDTTPLMAALQRFTETAPAAMSTLNERGWKERAQKELAPVATVARDLQKAAIKRAQELEERWKEWIAPPKTVHQEHLVELRGFLRSLKAADVMRESLSNGVAAISALELPSGIDGLQDVGIRTEIERSAAMFSLKKLYSAQAQRKPSLDNVLASGADDTALEKLATEALQNYRRALEDVEAVRNILNRTVIFYSIAADIDVKSSFEIMRLGE